MHETTKLLLRLIHLLGSKVYELQSGCASVYALCLERGLFTHDEYAQAKAGIQESEDMQRLRLVLEKLHNSLKGEDLEAFLRDYEGPIQ